MHRVLLLGAGKIGRMITRLLTGTGDYAVCVADASAESLQQLQQKTGVDVHRLDAANPTELRAAIEQYETVISALSFRFNPLIAEIAVDCGVNYFDLTEDVATMRAVQSIAHRAAAGRIVMPQCGLAPGFISILAHDLAIQFDEVDTVHMRVGALPKFPTNALKYNLTWSTDGLINEYCNLCEAIHHGRRMEVLPLEGLEQFSLDGVRYEAFNTSGGLGTLCESLDGQVRELNYKTIRYPGHQKLMSFLVNELHLGVRREILKDILEHSLPLTFQDVVITFCTCVGQRNGQRVQISDARKVYSRMIDGESWSAIQLTTAAGVCAVLDLFLDGRLPQQGLVKQEQVPLADFLNNRFGQEYRQEKS